MNFYNNKNEHIYLNIYDLYPINRFIRPLGLGFYHIGIEIYGTEYSFNKEGIFSIPPKTISKYPLRETIFLGDTNKNFHDIYSLILNLKREYTIENYNPFNNNCNHFCNAFIQHLSVSKIPEHISRLNNLFYFFLPKTNVIEDTRNIIHDLDDDLEMQKNNLIEIKIE
tara:strand:+ start:389 stop:892 length:504 start_codon:yes stop_codon:yes gene_type:complete